MASTGAKAKAQDEFEAYESSASEEEKKTETVPKLKKKLTGQRKLQQDIDEHVRATAVQIKELEEKIPTEQGIATIVREGIKAALEQFRKEKSILEPGSLIQTDNNELYDNNSDAASSKKQLEDTTSQDKATDVLKPEARGAISKVKSTIASTVKPTEPNSSTELTRSSDVLKKESRRVMEDSSNNYLGNPFAYAGPAPKWDGEHPLYEYWFQALKSHYKLFNEAKTTTEKDYLVDIAIPRTKGAAQVWLYNNEPENFEDLWKKLVKRNRFRCSQAQEQLKKQRQKSDQLLIIYIEETKRLFRLVKDEMLQRDKDQCFRLGLLPEFKRAAELFHAFTLQEVEDKLDQIEREVVFQNWQSKMMQENKEIFDDKNEDSDIVS